MVWQIWVAVTIEVIIEWNIPRAAVVMIIKCFCCVADEGAESLLPNKDSALVQILTQHGHSSFGNRSSGVVTLYHDVIGYRFIVATWILQCRWQPKYSAK